ncbi:MAG: hypothetical protein JRJ87_25365 [Deltaproteobacteria bacterium]|nr:hypothetical protein [Deltaproteobacteria bacterium]
MKRFGFTLLVATLFSGLIMACGLREQGAAGANSLIRLDEEPAGDNCDAGGTAIHSGVDTNNDGQLGDDEIISTSYVCGRTDAGIVLIRLDEEPEGRICLHGGTAVNVGFDSDGNGQLDDEEILSTYFVCNGESGVGSGVLEGSYTVRNSNDVIFISGYTAITFATKSWPVTESVVRLKSLETTIWGRVNREYGT